MVDPDIQLGWGKFNVTQYLTFISSLEGAKVYSQTGLRAMARSVPPLDSPLGALSVR